VLTRHGLAVQVCRTKRGEEAIMAIGVDSRPKSAIKDEIASIDGVIESQLFSEAPLSAAPTH
jgi:hypothetical protein